MKVHHLSSSKSTVAKFDESRVILTQLFTPVVSYMIYLFLQILVCTWRINLVCSGILCVILDTLVCITPAFAFPLY